MKTQKKPIAEQVSFWAQFIGSLGSLFFKGEEDKRKVIAISKGISDTALIIDESQQPQTVQDANLPSAPPSINGENP